MKPKYGAWLIAFILALVATILFVLLPSSATLTVAYIFCLIGILLMAVGFLLADIRNVPASYALLGQTGRFLPWTLTVSIIVLILERLSIFTLPAAIHTAVQIILLALLSVTFVQIFSGAAYMKQVEAKISSKRTPWVELTNMAQMLAARETEADAKAALKKVAEALRYADPMGVASSQRIEEQIETLLAQAFGADCVKKCEELLLLIQERNNIVKANK